MSATNIHLSSLLADLNQRNAYLPESTRREVMHWLLLIKTTLQVYAESDAKNIEEALANVKDSNGNSLLLDAQGHPYVMIPKALQQQEARKGKNKYTQQIRWISSLLTQLGALSGPKSGYLDMAINEFEVGELRGEELSALIAKVGELRKNEKNEVTREAEGSLLAEMNNPTLRGIQLNMGPGALSKMNASFILTGYLRAFRDQIFNYVRPSKLVQLDSEARAARIQKRRENFGKFNEQYRAGFKNVSFREVEKDDIYSSGDVSPRDQRGGATSPKSDDEGDRLREADLARLERERKQRADLKDDTEMDELLELLAQDRERGERAEFGNPASFNRFIQGLLEGLSELNTRMERIRIPVSSDGAGKNVAALLQEERTRIIQLGKQLTGNIESTDSELVGYLGRGQKSFKPEFRKQVSAAEESLKAMEGDYSHLVQRHNNLVGDLRDFQRYLEARQSLQRLMAEIEKLKQGVRPLQGTTLDGAHKKYLESLAAYLKDLERARGELDSHFSRFDLQDPDARSKRVQYLAHFDGSLYPLFRTSYNDYTILRNGLLRNYQNLTGQIGDEDARFRREYDRLHSYLTELEGVHRARLAQSKLRLQEIARDRDQLQLGRNHPNFSAYDKLHQNLDKLLQEYETWLNNLQQSRATSNGFYKQYLGASDPAEKDRIRVRLDDVMQEFSMDKIDSKNRGFDDRFRQFDSDFARFMRDLGDRERAELDRKRAEEEAKRSRDRDQERLRVEQERRERERADRERLERERQAAEARATASDRQLQVEQARERDLERELRDLKARMRNLEIKSGSEHEELLRLRREAIEKENAIRHATAEKDRNIARIRELENKLRKEQENFSKVLELYPELFGHAGFRSQDSIERMTELNGWIQELITQNLKLANTVRVLTEQSKRDSLKIQELEADSKSRDKLHAEEVLRLKADIARLQGQIVSIESGDTTIIRSHQDRITMLERQINAQQEKATTRENQVKAEIAQLREQLERANKERDDSKKREERLKTEFQAREDALRAEFDKERGRLNSERTAFEQQLGSVVAELEMLRPQLQTETQRRKAAEARVAALENELGGLDSKLKEVQRQNDGLQRALAALQADNKALQEQVRRLTAENGDLKRQVKELKDAVAELGKHNNELLTENNRLQMKNGDLEARNKELTADNKELKAANQEAQATIEGLNATLMEKDTEIHTLNTQNGELSAGKLALEEELERLQISLREPPQ